MPRTPAQIASHKRREKRRRHRRMLAGHASRRETITVWFPKPEDIAEQPRPALLEDEILEMQRELLKDIDK